MNFYLDFIVLYYIQIPTINHFTLCLSDGQRHCYQTLRLAKIILSFQEANISENMIHRTQVTMQTIFHFVIHTHSTSFCKTNKLIIKKTYRFNGADVILYNPRDHRNGGGTYLSSCNNPPDTINQFQTNPKTNAVPSVHKQLPCIEITRRQSKLTETMNCSRKVITFSRNHNRFAIFFEKTGGNSLSL